MVVAEVEAEAGEEAASSIASAAEIVVDEEEAIAERSGTHNAVEQQVQLENTFG